MLKLPLEKVTGRSIREHISPSHAEAFEKLLKECRSGKNRISKEIMLQRIDSTLVPTIMSFNNVTVDGAEATYAVVTDLTEHMEEEIKNYTKRLEAEVKEKAEALKNQERLAAIGETAGMVGHDLRNPLQTIVGELYIAKDELKQVQDGPSKDQLKETLNIIEDQVTYMNKIVTDLQDYTKPVKPQPEKTNISQLLQETLRDIEIPKAMTLTTKVENSIPELMIDRAMTQRVLTNLIINAIQAISNKGRITIEVNREDQHAVISVKDTGVGIPEENKPNIFKPLFTTKAKGQGFGLAVVKRFVEAQKGTITFESKEGKGSTFTVRLPIPKTTQ
ncbi:MAG: nitrogen regulation protein NR(II) [Candidatus Bathyarchaeia archaeon]